MKPKSHTTKKSQPPRRKTMATRTTRKSPAKTAPGKTANLAVPSTAGKNPSTPPKLRKLAEQPRPSYWRKNWYYVFGFVSALVLFGVSAWLLHRHMYVGREQALLRHINDLPDKFRWAFIVLATLGSFWTAAVIVVAAFLLRLYQLAWRLALSVFTAFGLILVLQHFLTRQRPEEFVGGLHVRLAESGSGFPSVHIAIATVVALTVQTYLPVPLLYQWLITTCWIAGVAFSRLYLGVSLPLDIAAGFAIGLGVVCFWRILPKAIKKVMHLK